LTYGCTKLAYGDGIIKAVKSGSILSKIGKNDWIEEKTISADLNDITYNDGKFTVLTSGRSIFQTDGDPYYVISPASAPGGTEPYKRLYFLKKYFKIN
jgi:hypothetical protein